MTEEYQRLEEARNHIIHWKRWGPYLSERQWGTVREDYSPDGQAWDYFTHDQARSRTYRWGEDGILGICDDQQYLCFALALWNGKDPILKERIYGLTGTEGNHGEDVKEYYFYLDSTPTHSYMKGLYKYPQAEFPYTWLVEENQRRGALAPEFELLDTGVFQENRYYDVFLEYAKASAEQILIQITAINRGPDPQTLHILPTLWFRNTWSWNPNAPKPLIKVAKSDQQFSVLEASHPTLGQRWFYCEGSPELLVTDNETNYQRLFGVENQSAYVKDGINNYVVQGDKNAVNPSKVGTKVAPHYEFTIAPGETRVIKLWLSDAPNILQPFGSEFSQIIATRRSEADQFYHAIAESGAEAFGHATRTPIAFGAAEAFGHATRSRSVGFAETPIAPPGINDDHRNIQRQAFAGLLWSKQYYYYDVDTWLKGDPNQPPPPPERLKVRNQQWNHLNNADIISMPDKWEYPWFAAWDLAFHCIPLAMIDPDFAKNQLDLMTREWSMHPNGQIPAYEWNFSDVNPPVHGWATWQVYQLEKQLHGTGDRLFLERVFQKLLLNFTWWVNRKDFDGNNVFEGGFLGLDNIGVFDRSSDLPSGGYIEQSDGTSWMGMYCLNMLTIALELALENPVYEDMATKFFEHFLYIAAAMNNIGEDETQLWDEEDGFFYDVLHLPNGEHLRLKVRSMVGLIPLFAVTTIEPDTLNKLPGFKKRLEWFIQHRPDLKRNVACMETQGVGEKRMLALCYMTVGKVLESDKFRRILSKLLDENEFLSDYGIRGISKFHKDNPYRFYVNDHEHRVDYEPGESSSGLFGGNSNWRGPIWMPLNYLLIESLQTFHYYLGDTFKVECPTGSGNLMTLGEVSVELSRRLIRIFQKNQSSHRPIYGKINQFQSDHNWNNLILFYEYFHGDSGLGVGASHQTGWTGLIAKLIQQCADYSG